MPVTYICSFVYSSLNPSICTICDISNIYILLKFVFKSISKQQRMRRSVHAIAEQPDALETLLQFVTCLREPPVLGFNPPAKLNFTHPDPNDEYDGTPYANTCGNALSIPVLLSYETFVERMNLALTVGTVFTNS